MVKKKKKKKKKKRIQKWYYSHLVLKISVNQSIDDWKVLFDVHQILVNCDIFEMPLTCLVGIMIPIFSTALANSSGSTVPFPFKSKYLKDFLSTCSSEVMPDDF